MLQPLNNKNFMILLTLGLLIPVAGGYILDVPPKPALANDSIPYLDDFIVPRSVEIMEIKEIYEITVILSMLTVNLIKVYGAYLIIRKPEDKFNPAYLVSGLLGVFIGYSIFVPTADFSGTLVDIFMEAGKDALLGTFAFDFYAKVKEKSETKNG